MITHWIFVDGIPGNQTPRAGLAKNGQYAFDAAYLPVMRKLVSLQCGNTNVDI